MITAMAKVGNRFQCGEYFVPEMLIAARNESRHKSSRIYRMRQFSLLAKW
jgi:methanogenic corrinoid protein MtbC1